MKRAINWWSKLSPTFLQVLGVIFLAGYAWPIINPNLSPALHSLCNWTLFVIWVFFAFDYFARLSIADDKRLFVRKNLLDLAAVSLPFLPLLRAIRALAAVTVLSRRNRGSRSQQVTTSVVTLAFATWFVAGLAVTEAERHVVGSNIQGVGDGWWWAITTMATVGYGDTYPVSTQGRIVGTALMIMGVALLGTITASIASNFNSTDSEDSSKGASSISELDELKKRVAELEGKLGQ
ncbi:MAG: potassium channel family protein [Candidatus Nanopelagicales bacterium]|nr:potassium channel family protein [Candidatus Nanopelagicales bacterium]